MHNTNIVPVPWLSILDKSLHPTDRQVLAVLCRFEDPLTHIATTDRKTIGLLLGLHETNVSQSTTRLVANNWLTKDGKGKGTRYFINWHNTPSTIPESATVQSVPSGSTIAESTTVQSDSTGSTIPESATVQSVQSDSTGSTIPESATVEHHQTCRTIAESATVECSNTNHGTTIRTDQKIRSDSEDLIINNLIFREGEVVTFQQAVDILKKHGCKYSINQDLDNENTHTVNKWITDGVTVELLSKAAERAACSKTRLAPLGPRYVDGCIHTILNHKARPEKIYIPPVSDEKGLEKMAKDYGIGTKGVPSYQALRGLVEDAVRREEQAAA